MPALLCSHSEFLHAGTTDIDVQVDLEIAAGAVNARRLERALRDAGFKPDQQWAWRWVARGTNPDTVVKFELLADRENAPAESTLRFDGCESLGAVNLRGTGFAAHDVQVHRLTSGDVDSKHPLELNVVGLAGYLLAKTAAARERRLPKDWYDLAFVLIHNDAGGPSAAAEAVAARFSDDLIGPIRTALEDLAANFADPRAQGPAAYTNQMLLDHPDLNSIELAADAVVAVGAFCELLMRVPEPVSDPLGSTGDTSNRR